MKLRNVQKTGNMFYVYLPTKWCRDKSIAVGSRIEIETDSSGNLLLSAKQRKKIEKKLNLDLNDTDLDMISKLIMSCFLSPVGSFEINFPKPLDYKELFDRKKLINTTFIEIDKNKIYSEPFITISNTLSLFMNMVQKVRHLIKILINDYDPELIDRYEEEIDRSNAMINKAVIASFMHKRESKLKLVELHYISLLSNYVERMTDHLIKIDKIDKKEKAFLNNIDSILKDMAKIVGMIKDKEEFNHETVLELAKRIKKLKADNKIVREMLTKTSLRHCSEILLDWSITNRIEE